MSIKDIDLNLLLDVLKVFCALVILIGVKMKWWKSSDFKIADKIAIEGIKAGLGHTEIASRISDNTKLTATQALVEIREVKKDLSGDKKPIAKRAQRAGRKLLWRLFDGGL